ncbi:hypothetical protein P167DRAFT_565764 [Morchella conica CCBAS932]|uniref:Uncharacterized protein n=1 Tax=Morchella conica CCBAS932 TaxID=1392247 RepID=A0A3N4KQE1_9PEZI|nr:hypothetical protein P167DRAFT_565764 [Morchella conica CCBAS932]
MCFGRNDSSRDQLLEERKKFKRCFEEFLMEIQDSQKFIVELAKIETMRRQKIAAESSIRMTAERITQEAASTERFRVRQEEMHERNMEYTRRAQESREETTLVFTIVTTIFLPLNFFTSYYALAIGCRKQMSRSRLYYWAKAKVAQALYWVKGRPGTMVERWG